MSKNRPIIRQGDVLLLPITRIPAGSTPVARDGGRVVLAYGEVTGHAHAIADPDVELLDAPAKTADAVDRFLRVRSRTAVLAHEEHGAIAIAPGAYRVIRQVEWTDAMEPRRVAD